MKQVEINFSYALLHLNIRQTLQLHYKYFGINSKIHSPWYLNFVISKQNHKIFMLQSFHVPY